MKFENKYRLCLYKSYFDTGMAWTNYLKYLLVAFGFASQSVYWTLIIGFIYAFGSFLLGWALFKYGWVKAAIEVSNKQNLFVKEVRKKI